MYLKHRSDNVLTFFSKHNRKLQYLIIPRRILVDHVRTIGGEVNKSFVGEKRVQNQES